MQNLNKKTKFLIKLSKKASKIMMKYYSPLGVMSEFKSDLSPVTMADIEINKMVIKSIKNSYPEYEILAEEISTYTNNTKKLFVIDPLDGTLMYKIGGTAFCFSAAIVENGESMAGVISNPLAKRTLIAEKNSGAYLVETNSQIHVSTRTTLEEAIVNTGWINSSFSQLLHKNKAFTTELYSVCEAGSLIALSGIDGMFFLGKNAYDIAALKIIIEEAGGKVTDLNGNEQLYNQAINGAILSNGKLHTTLLKIAQQIQ